ncbi:disrupted in renal carcinoma protein 2 homolog [Plakobranchus ocellatus]|uniref:Disrupted in renal carcinoma protein 2 homolog n=1 Tax=Plakobranchus ocellatus TaxID=259542 RepID=A0AAV4BV51_9GAST|nr:disrupted in renal carcinoma protein 2 homolog [Plakobranchus ocellatus]
MKMDVNPGSINRPTNTEVDETSQLLRSASLLNNEIQVKVYKRRWYILTMFSIFCFTQGAMWNTFGPISETCEEAFGWSDATIAWITNWGSVSFMVTAFQFFWMMQVKGLRWAVLTSSFFLLFGAAFRVISSSPKTATILFHIGQFVSGFAGPVSMGAGPAVSAVWFPPNERVTATAISTSMGLFGVAVPYLLGPFIVERGIPTVHNSTKETSQFHSSVLQSDENDMDVFSNSTQFGNITDIRIQKEREQIMLYMYIECIWCGLLFLIILCYFPKAPSLPPSMSANTGRQSYWAGTFSLFKNRHFLFIAITYAISSGVYGAWQSVLDVNLKPEGISEKDAGWIGFYSTVASCVAAVLVGRFGDLFARHMKLFILALFVVATACFAIFSLELLGGVIPRYDALLYGTVIAGSTFLLSATPMLFELACETAFPASESAANGMLTILNNLLAILFMIPFAVPNIGTMWMNWTLTGSCLVSIPFITMMSGGFRRLALDEYTNQEQIVDPGSVDIVADHDYSVAFCPPSAGLTSAQDMEVSSGSKQGRDLALSQQDLGYGSTSVLTPVEVHIDAATLTDNQKGAAHI